MGHTQKAVGDIHIHNREAESVSSLFPSHLRGISTTLISFLEDYYEYLNSKDQPTNIIDRIQNEHDIDLTDNLYLDQIKKEIAKSIPNSDVLDNRELFRNIISFYKSRGSQGSINEFFRLFFNDQVTVTYPSEQLIKPSSGEISNFGFIKRNGDRVFYDTTTKTFEEDVPTGPTILTPDYTPSNPGYIKIGSNFENIFWTYDKLSVDKTFTIRVSKGRADSGYSSPETPASVGLSFETRVNSGDNKLSTELTDATPVDITIDTSEIIYDSPIGDYTYRLGTYTEDKRIFDKNLDTGVISNLRDSNSLPYSQTFDLIDRHLYFGENNQLGAIATGRNHALLPTRAGGKYFSDVIFESPDKETVYNFYAFEDATISFYIDYERGLSSGSAFAPTLIKKKRVKAGKYGTFITNTYGSPSNQHVVFFSSTGNIAGSTYTTGGAQDMTVLSPMSSDYVSRGDPGSRSTKFRITWDLDNQNLDISATTAVRHTISTNSIYGVVQVNDGLNVSPHADGNDKCQGIPVGYCNDTYMWPDGLTGYTIVSPYDENEIKVYQLDSSGQWDLYESVSPTKNVSTQNGSYSGDTTPIDNFIGPNSPQENSHWKFEGTYPFALWVNDNLNDEELVWGWNRSNYNLPIYTQFSNYNDRKGFNSDINKLHDGERWQEFSYIITTGISFDRWKQQYFKLVHPSGLKLFSDLQIESIQSRSDKDVVPSWDITNPTWVGDLYTGLRNHTPFYQPGWLDEGGNINVFITAAPFNMTVDSSETDQDLLSTYAIGYDSSSVSGLLSLTLTTTYVVTDTSYVLMNTNDSPVAFLETSTFETGRSTDDSPDHSSTSAETDSWVSWDTPIDAVDTQTPQTFPKPLDVSVSDLSNVRAYLNSTTSVTEHQTPIKVLDRNLPLTDVFFPDSDSPLEQSITETFA
jgi:hypothetical protein